jgi:hypothetical protein
MENNETTFPGNRMNSPHSSLGTLGQIVTLAGFKVPMALTLAAGGTSPAIPSPSNPMETPWSP